jgi:flagellar motor switch protein FliG
MSLLSAADKPGAFGGLEKTVAVLLGIERDIARLVLRHFNEEELRLVARTAAELNAVPHKALDDICEALCREIAVGSSDLVGDVARAEDLLSGVVAEEQLADILSDLRGVSNAFFWRRLADLPEKVVASHLMVEHPQIAAIVVTKVDPAFAARILTELPGETRTIVMRRVLVSKPVAETVMREIEQVLQLTLYAGLSTPGAEEVNSRVAGIINQLEREEVNELLDGLGRSEPVIAAQLKSLIFSFEDIVKLDQRARSILCDQTPTERIIMALRDADIPVRDAILPCLSARTRRMVEAELAAGSDTPKREILAAQRQIADTVLRLAEQGLIALSAADDAVE